MPEEKLFPRDIAAVQKPRQYEEPVLPFLIQVDDFLWVSRAPLGFPVVPAV